MVATLFSPRELFQRSGHELERVVLFGRHGLRSPLVDNASTLGQLTPYPFPVWEVPPGHLITKGGQLEVAFGHYLAGLLADAGLVEKGVCPSPQQLSLYANGYQRTLATAQFFALGAFPGCELRVDHHGQLGSMDPLFSVAVPSPDQDFIAALEASIEAQAGPGGLAAMNEALAPLYGEMSRVINLAEAQAALEDLGHMPTHIKLEYRKAPSVAGPLQVCSSLADTFLAEHYLGTPIEQVGWGRVGDRATLARLVTLKDRYLRLKFAASGVVGYSTVLLAARLHSLLSAPRAARINLMVGHDSNLTSILTRLQVAEYQLPGQMEITPIGGKLVFAIWRDAHQQRWLSLDYLYQSVEQIYQGSLLSDANPAQRYPLQLAPDHRAGELYPLDRVLECLLA